MEVFLFEKEFDEEAVEAGVDVPVEEAEVVADGVVSVLGELDGLASPLGAAFAAEFPGFGDEYELLLTNNRIFQDRTRGVGRISAEDAVDLGLTGPNLRGSGPSYDVRKNAPYLVYDRLDFEVAVGTEGDCYDRYMVRVEKMRQAARILRQAVSQLPSGPIYPEGYEKYVLPPKSKVYTKMEELIHQFKIVTELKVPEGEVYSRVESPRGELGMLVISDGGDIPYRVKVRGPSFCNLATLPVLAKDHLVADLVAIIGSLDIVLGDVDR